MMSTTRTHSMNTRSRSGALKAAPAFQFDPFCEHDTDSDEEYTPPPTKKPRPTLVLPRTVDLSRYPCLHSKLWGECVVAMDTTEVVDGHYEERSWAFAMEDIGLHNRFTYHVYFDDDGQQKELYINDDEHPTTGQYLYFSGIGPRMLALADEGGEEDYEEWRLLTLADTAALAVRRAVPSALPACYDPNRPTSPVYDPQPPSSPRYSATSPVYDPNNPHPPLSPACPTSPVYNPTLPAFGALFGALVHGQNNPPRYSNPRVAEYVESAVNALMALSSS